MTVLHYKPQVWSKVLLAALEKTLVFGSQYVINRDYEGEIARLGDVLHITSMGDPVISNYVINAGLNYQQILDAGQSLQIDQAKYWATIINDVDRRQQMGDFQGFFEDRANYKLADQMDQFIAAMYTGVAPANVLGSSGAPLTPGVYSSSAVADLYLKVLIPLGVLLSQNNVPKQGRYVVLPPWATGLLAQTQAFIAFPGTNGAEGVVFENGAVGRAAGFVILESNNTVQTVAGGPGTGVWAIQAGHNSAITFGDQVAENEALRAQTDFGDLVRGLHVYGAKLTRPEALAVAYVERPTGI
ncbi:MAG TPA: hypothetical protein VGG83_10835 [Trebonia sp.]|jgi:hypothetical protein